MAREAFKYGYEYAAGLLGLRYYISSLGGLRIGNMTGWSPVIECMAGNRGPKGGRSTVCAPNLAWHPSSENDLVFTNVLVGGVAHRRYSCLYLNHVLTAPNGVVSGPMAACYEYFTPLSNPVVPEPGPYRMPINPLPKPTVDDPWELPSPTQEPETPPPEPDTPPVSADDPSAEPDRMPAVAIRFSPRGSVRTTPASGPRLAGGQRGPARTAPGRGTKEGKWTGSRRALAALARVFTGATEWDDIVDGLYDALKKETQDKCRKQGLTGLAGKAQCIYTNFGDMDLMEALRNTVANALEDLLIGRGNAAFEKAINGLRTDMGLSTISTKGMNLESNPAYIPGGGSLQDLIKSWLPF